MFNFVLSWQIKQKSQLFFQNVLTWSHIICFDSLCATFNEPRLRFCQKWSKFGEKRRNMDIFEPKRISNWSRQSRNVNKTLSKWINFKILRKNVFLTKSKIHLSFKYDFSIHILKCCFENLRKLTINSLIFALILLIQLFTRFYTRWRHHQSK